ncbi:MAG: hypothetical protein QOD39_1788 [Mycobacterium sp.]|jgi:hypothetical protein|nr:hypothetical protein [Mycobacterium sp.]
MQAGINSSGGALNGTTSGCSFRMGLPVPQTRTLSQIFKGGDKIWPTATAEHLRGSGAGQHSAEVPTEPEDYLDGRLKALAESKCVVRWSCRPDCAEGASRSRCVVPRGFQGGSADSNPVGATRSALRAGRLQATSNGPPQAAPQAQQGDRPHTITEGYCADCLLRWGAVGVTSWTGSPNSPALSQKIPPVAVLPIQ